MAPLLGFLAELPSLRCLSLNPVLDLVSLVPMARLTQLEGLQLNLAPLVIPPAYAVHHLAALSCLRGLKRLQLILEEPFSLSSAVNKPLTSCLPPSLTYLALNHHPWIGEWVPFMEDCTDLRVLRLLSITSRAPVEAHPSVLFHALAPRLRKLEVLHVGWNGPLHQDYWPGDPSPDLGAPSLSPEGEPPASMIIPKHLL
jgi:hypothetical protein